MNPTCIVSGASGQLGHAVVEALCKANFFVEAIGRKDLDKSKAENVQYTSLDLRDELPVQHFLKASIEQHKSIQAAALLAGGFAMGSLENTAYADLEKQLNINFKTVYTLIRPLYQHMQEHGGGNIIVIAAKGAQHLELGKGALAYTLSKSLLLNLAAILNADRDQTKVTIHVIVPGTIDTPSNREAMPKADMSKWVKPSVIASKIVELLAGHSSENQPTIHTFY